jgi:hypothetical protein
MKYWRNHRVRGWREYAAFLALVLTTLACGAVLLGFTILRPSPQTLGITYSSKYAQSLGLDPQSAFTEIVDDLGVTQVRLPVYWSDVETAPGVYDFTQLDAMLDAAALRDLSVTLALGMKVPRWPECFIPEFYSHDSEFLDPAILRYVQELVMHTRTYDVVTRWQVENEPLFPYGDCPEPSMERLRREVALVRALDTRPILMTVSGEQEPWLDLASIGDVIGVSMYRFAFQQTLGPIAFPHTPMYYRLHAFLTRFFVDEVIITELQMEPWFTGNPQDPASLDVPFSAEDFTAHLQFAKDTGIHEALLWGAEWWYYEHLRGDDSLWNAALSAFAQDSLE